ncbi:MAG: hypothetical protein WAK17_12945 [Candidatus Nitrosopolaris sp.]|jgi:hypothetical protein
MSYGADVGVSDIRYISNNRPSMRMHSKRRNVLSDAERLFLNRLIRGRDLESYADTYKRNLKHRILQKRKRLTDDLLLINAALDELQSL